MDGLKILVLMHVICSYMMNVQSSHFRGGTVSWMVAPSTNTTVLFTFKMGWTYGRGPGCNDSMIGEFIDHRNTGYWQCISGCLTNTTVVGNTTYWCTGASKRDDWENGENTFNYTFPGLGPYTIAFMGSAWMRLSYGNPSDWTIQTIVDLHTRSDTGRPNTSPRTASRPMYRLQFDCPHQLKLPIIDQDGDRVKCRWARGEECASVCEVLPSAHLDEDTCTVSFDANSTQNYSESGWYAVALTVEDFPQTNITIGNMSFTPNDPITAVPLQVLFTFKMGWTYMKGPGCNESRIGEFIGQAPPRTQNVHWRCISGCATNTTVVGDITYWCTGASEKEDWEQGENTFNYTFPGLGPYTIAYQGALWMILSYGDSNGWTIQTIVDLRPRSDTGRPNTSPRTASRPMYRVQYDCPHQLKLPMIDQDGDRVKCRWARGEECDSVCEILPYAHLDEDTCTVSFVVNSTQKYTANGWYAVALTIEDFPQTTMTIGNKTFTPNDPITAVPLQFLVFTPTIPVDCPAKPAFIDPTPKEGETIYVKATDTLQLKYYAQVIGGNGSISGMSATRPPGLKISAIKDDPARLGVTMWDIEWTPKEDQAGVNILCTHADDTNGKSSEPRCISLIAWDVDPCSSSPCSGNQTCHRMGYSNNYACLCPPGFTGNVCETDIDECASSPCENNSTCTDHVANFRCSCTSGYQDERCQTEISRVTSSSSSLPVILGSVLGSLVLLTLVAIGAAVWWWYASKRRKVNDDSTDQEYVRAVNGVN